MKVPGQAFREYDIRGIVGETLDPDLARAVGHAYGSELGTGKTCLTKGIAQGLRVPAEQFVRSPSFVIVNRYEGIHPIWHIDAYRLDSPLDFVALGYEDYIDSGCIAVIEWADRANDLLPARAIRIVLQHLAPTERRIHIDFSGLAQDRIPRWRHLLLQ